MKFDISFYLSIDQQIKLLQESNLKIIRLESLKKYLNIYGYDNLINDFKKPFILGYRKQNKTFRDDSNSESIIELFNFDRKIAKYFLSNIQNIERFFINSICTVILEKIKDRINKNLTFFEFLQKNYFLISKNNNFISKFEEKRNGDTYNENDKKYRNIWTYSKYWTFGQAIHIYKLLNKDLKRNIVKKMMPENTNFESFFAIFFEFISCIKHFRNLICHNNVFFDAEFKTGSKLIDFVSKKFNIKFHNNKFKTFQLSLIIDFFWPQSKTSRNLREIFDEKLNHLKKSDNISTESFNQILIDINYECSSIKV